MDNKITWYIKALLFFVPIKTKYDIESTPSKIIFMKNLFGRTFVLKEVPFYSGTSNGRFVGPQPTKQSIPRSTFDYLKAEELVSAWHNCFGYIDSMGRPVVVNLDKNNLHKMGDIYQSIADEFGVTRQFVKSKAFLIMYGSGTIDEKIQMIKNNVRAALGRGNGST